MKRHAWFVTLRCLALAALLAWGGALAVTFELLDAEGERIGTHALEEHFGPTGLADPQPLDVAATNVGNAYIWFHLPYDEVVAIDRYQVRSSD
jgi:hypothetical protein